jgi:hypothetical protein
MSSSIDIMHKRTLVHACFEVDYIRFVYLKAFIGECIWNVSLHNNYVLDWPFHSAIKRTDVNSRIPIPFALRSGSETQIMT